MTDDRMALAQLLERGSDSDLLREMIGYVAQRLMQLDVDGLVGAAHGEPLGTQAVANKIKEGLALMTPQWSEREAA